MPEPDPKPASSTPPLFPMRDAFGAISQVGKIRVVHSEGETIGELVPYYLSQRKLFGARIDITHAPVFTHQGPPVSFGEFETVGHFTVTSYKLSLDKVLKIETTNDPEVPYQIKI